MPSADKTEYRIKSTNSKGDVFVARAIQTDINEALEIFRKNKDNFMTKTTGAVITMERHRVTTEIEDYTEIAEKMLKGK